jgi:predicted dehydrogenase
MRHWLVRSPSRRTLPVNPVRIPFIGVGNRGTHLLKLTLPIPGVTIPEICDANKNHLNRSVRLAKNAHGSIPASFSKNPHEYRRMIERDDFDAVLIATPPSGTPRWP